ncbi:MAG TPA: hypothetical protein VF755_04545 [Catenuloplanes sp.]
MPDNHPTERGLLTSADWDIPVTEEFVTRVRRGVGIRRTIRAAAAGGALMVTAGVAVTVVSLAGGPDPVAPTSPGAAPPAASTAAEPRPLDGFTVGYLPDNATAKMPDSVHTAAVDQRGLRTDGTTVATTADRALVTMRRFDRGSGVGLFVTVLRPTPGSASAVRPAQLSQWLTAWATTGGTQAKTFDVPIGTARLLTEPGTEVTSHKVVINASAGVVIVIEGNSSYPADEMEKVARGLSG